MPVPTTLFRPVVALTLLTTLAACSKSPEAGTPADSAAVANATADSTGMARGLALIGAGDHVGAISAFREILGRTEGHYGARYQLARALDLAGRPLDARAEWDRFRPMAERSADSTSLQFLGIRLAQQDSLTAEELMGRGLELMYGRNLPAEAAAEFRQVLVMNPQHYGAHYQLATALDRQGMRAEAREWWVKMLPMAEAIRDTATVTAVRTRLARTD